MVKGFKMTIDEANKKLWSCGNIDTLSKVECGQIIKEIYIDFESRTCSNCKYFIRGEDSMDDMAFCDNEDSLMEVWEDYVEMMTFSCNKFKRKINEE